MTDEDRSRKIEKVRDGISAVLANAGSTDTKIPDLTDAMVLLALARVDGDVEQASHYLAFLHVVPESNFLIKDPANLMQQFRVDSARLTDSY